MTMTQFEKIMDFNPNNSSLWYGLGIDTTRSTLNLALGTATNQQRSQSWHLDRDLAAQLHPLLSDFLRPQQWTNLAWIAVVKGPGSFTGTRLGVVTARTLSQQLNLPLYGLSALAIAAWHRAHNSPQKEGSVVAVSQPGQRGYTYGAIYRVQTDAIVTLYPDQLFVQAEWEALLRAEHNHIDTHIQPNLTAADPVPASLGQVMLTLGWQAWHQGTSSHWREVLPYYG